jgi:hypothetical protein
MDGAVRSMVDGNPCKGKIGGRMELIATAVVSEGTVRVFRQDFALEDTIGSHACSLANMLVTNGTPLGHRSFYRLTL